MKEVAKNIYQELQFKEINTIAEFIKGASTLNRCNKKE